MPRAKWGDEITTDVIEEYEDTGFKPYTGKQPPNGVYLFEVVYAKQVMSSNDNPQLKVLLKLEPRDDRPEEKQYAGAPSMDFMPVLKRTDFRWVPFINALGVSSKDFVNNTVLDTDDKETITKIGRTEVAGKYVYANVVTKPDNNGVPRLNVQSYLSAADVEGEDSGDDGGDEEGDAPF